jgi:hypothetical protein
MVPIGEAPLLVFTADRIIRTRPCGGVVTLYELQRLLYEVKRSDELRERFLAGDVDGVARGYDLTPGEVGLLKGDDAVALYHYGVNPVLVLFFGYLWKMRVKPEAGSPGGY